MEDGAARRACRIEPDDRAARLGRTGIAVRRHHDGQRGGVAEARRRQVGEATLRDREHRRDQVALEPHHQHLGLWIAEAGIIFDQLGALRGEHQPGIEHAAERDAVRRHRRDGGRDDLVERALFEVGGEHGRRAVGAHPAGVGAGIALADALVILRRAKRHQRGAVGEDEEARLLAFKEFLDHRLRLAVREQRVERGLGLGAGEGDDDALARRQPVGLDDHGQREGAGERDVRVGAVRYADIARGRNPCARAQILGEALRPFELGSGPGRTEDGDGSGAQRVGEAVDERRLGADHDEADALFADEGDDGSVIRRIEAHERRKAGDAGVARRGIERIEARRKAGRLHQLPRERMFAAPRAQQQDVHARSLFR